jgi:hypothetical protein
MVFLHCNHLASEGTVALIFQTRVHLTLPFLFHENQCKTIANFANKYFFLPMREKYVTTKI